jgi:hypothetical protein
MPGGSKFQTYEAQSRLLVAVLAANPNLKLNFKGTITVVLVIAQLVLVREIYKVNLKRAGLMS